MEGGMRHYQEFAINYYQDEDGFFTAQIPAIRGCVAWGKTLEETYRNAVDAIESCLEARRKVSALSTAFRRKVDHSADEHPGATGVAPLRRGGSPEPPGLPTTEWATFFRKEVLRLRKPRYAGVNVYRRPVHA
jgi:predicted RNase H-like HicB family nuclease